MKLSKDTLKIWKDLREHGDFTEMENKSKVLVGAKVYRQHLAKAFKEGKCATRTYQLLDKFYTERQKLINQ